MDALHLEVTQPYHSDCNRHLLSSSSSGQSLPICQNELIRLDGALQKMLGIERFPVDDTIWNLFERFQQEENQRVHKSDKVMQ